MTSTLKIPVNARDHTAGPLNATAVLLEYGDFECPHCAAAYPIVEAVRQYLGDDMCLAYRHFPLAEIHPHAARAAEAAEAAGAQGKFWEMHHMLFEHQDALEPDDLAAYAEHLHLDVAQFSTELARRTHAWRVSEDLRGGAWSGVNGTPTFFINRLRYDGPWNDVPSLVGALTRAAAAATRRAPLA